MPLVNQLEDDERSGSLREIWTLSIPVIVAVLSQSLVGMVDSIFLGRVGTIEQGAVGLGAITFFTLIVTFSGTLQGITTFASQYLGAGRDFDVGTAGWRGLTLAIPAGVLMVGISAANVGHALFSWMGVAPAVAPLAADYMQIRLAGAGFVFVNFAIVCFLRGVGDTRTPMYFTFVLNAVNAALNYALIFGHFGFPALGVQGAAWASVASTGMLSVGYLIVFFTGSRARRFHTRSWRPIELAGLTAFFRLGFPIGLSFALELVSWTIFIAITARLGPVELAASHVVVQIIHLSFMGAVGLGVGGTSLVGRYLGAEALPAARRTARRVVASAAVYCAVLALMFLWLRAPLIRVFNPDPEVVALGSRLFLYAIAFQVIDGVGTVATAVVRGAGDTRWPMIYTVIVSFGLFAPSVLWLSGPGGFGVDGAWMGATGALIVLGVGMFLRYRSGKWESMRV